MANRFIRLLRHRRLDAADARRLVGSDALARIGQRVTASEQHHTGQIRVSIEAGLPLSYLRRGASPRERAQALFGKLGVWDTEYNNGVLIYVLLAERAIEIVTDRALYRLTDSAAWNTIVARMREAFQAGRHEDGLNQAVDAVDVLLRAHFPRAPGAPHPNELPDAPDVR